MAKLKTKATEASVKDFLAKVPDETRRKDAQTLLKLMEKATGWKAKMWGPSIIGFGAYEYEGSNGKSQKFLVTGFSPRKANLVVYVMPGFAGAGAQMKKLGKHKTGKSCLYLGPLSGIDLPTLETIVSEGVAAMKKKYKVSAG
jgi:hypothetical protein